MTIFDPASYLEAALTEPSTRRPPLPAGRDFVGFISTVTSRSWQGKKDPSKSGIAVDVSITLDLTAYPDLGEAYKGINQVILIDGVMLDLTEGGMIDNSPGKNGKLRRYREALDMNKPGVPFSWNQAVGHQILVKISHRTYEGELYDEVDSVARVK